MRKLLLPGAVLLALSLFGCDQQKLISMFASPAQEKAGHTFFEHVRSGDFAPVRTATDNAFRAQLTPEMLAAMRNVFGPRPVKSVKTINARLIGQKLFGKSGTVDRELTFEYDMGDRYVIAEIVLREIGSRMQIEGIHVQPINRSIEQINAFTFRGKSAGYFVFLAFAVAIPIFIIVTAVYCWRTTIPQHKWLWRIGVLLGFTGFTLNWTTGDFQFLPIHVDVLGAGFSRQLYGPVILQIGMPVGAIMFWILRHKWLDQSEISRQQVD